MAYLIRFNLGIYNTGIEELHGTWGNNRYIPNLFQYQLVVFFLGEKLSNFSKNLGPATWKLGFQGWNLELFALKASWHTKRSPKNVHTLETFRLSSEWVVTVSRQIALKGTLHLPMCLPRPSNHCHFFPPSIWAFDKPFPSCLKIFTTLLHVYFLILQRFRSSYVTNLHFVTLESSRVWILMLELTLCHVFMSRLQWSFLVSWILILCTSSLCCNLQLAIIFELSRFTALCSWFLSACSTMFKPHSVVNSSSLKDLRWQLQCSFFC
jgi:hypothetical protein